MIHILNDATTSKYIEAGDNAFKNGNELLGSARQLSTSNDIIIKRQVLNFWFILFELKIQNFPKMNIHILDVQSAVSASYLFRYLEIDCFKGIKWMTCYYLETTWSPIKYDVIDNFHRQISEILKWKYVLARNYFMKKDEFKENVRP